MMRAKWIEGRNAAFAAAMFLGGDVDVRDTRRGNGWFLVWYPVR